MLVRRMLQLLFLCSMALTTVGCALKAQNVPSWHEEPFFVSFTAKVAQKEELPLQGGMEISTAGGRMALMTQHGRTLGLCTWQTSSAQFLRLQCEASQGLGTQVQTLVQHVALAAYRIVYDLKHAKQGQSVESYSIRSQGNVFLYSDDSVHMEMMLSEGAQ